MVSLNWSAVMSCVATFLLTLASSCVFHHMTGAIRWAGDLRNSVTAFAKRRGTRIGPDEFVLRSFPRHRPAVLSVLCGTFLGRETPQPLLKRTKSKRMERNSVFPARSEYDFVV